MTESSDKPPTRLRRMIKSTRGRLEIVALSLVVVVCGAVAFTVVPAIAGDEKLAGTPVPAADVHAVVAAALSCPTLNPPRVAAQLMGASGYSDGGAHGNIAGMDAGQWKAWVPFKGAKPGEHSAAITALAHRTCENVGKLRAAGLKGDLWPAAVAAETVGLQAVIDAKGVPAAEQKRVDNISAYARWYADRPEFDVAAKPATDSSAAAAGEVRVPDELVPVVQAAGKICPAVTPVRIAAQLRSLSNFDLNLRSADGAEGVAQIPRPLWAKYSSRPKASVYDPTEAIPVMGVAMCDLTRELSGIGGADSYVLALSAYQWGEKVVRQAGGLPRTTVPQLSDAVLGHLAEYEKDARLKPEPKKPVEKPKPSPSASRSPSPSAKPSPPASKTPEPDLLYQPGKNYQLLNVHSNSILDVPGDNPAPAAGEKVQLWQFNNSADMFWRLDPVDGEYVTFTNAFNHVALSVEGGLTDNGVKLVVEPPAAGNQSQQWSLRKMDDGNLSIVNRKSGKAIDLLGDDFAAPFADGTWNGYLLELWDHQDYAKDQRWKLIEQ